MNERKDPDESTRKRLFMKNIRSNRRGRHLVDRPVTNYSQILKVISRSAVDPKGTSVTGSKDMVRRQIVTSVQTSAACTVEFILRGETATQMTRDARAQTGVSRGMYVCVRLVLFFLSLFGSTVRRQYRMR